MKVCVHSVISLIISIISAVSFCLLLELSGYIKEIVRVVWHISSVLCIVYPIFSKFRRKNRGLSGRGLEITALVIDFWTFQFWLMYAVGANDIVNWVLVITCYVIYAKTSNNIDPEKEAQVKTPNISNKNLLNEVTADCNNVAQSESPVLPSSANSANIQSDSLLPRKAINPPKEKRDIYMKRGTIRIVLGIILIALQIMSVIGNQLNGTVTFSPPASSAQLLFDIVFYGAYYFVGIVGLILLISGLFAYFDIHVFSKREQAKSAKQRFCKYCGQPIDQETKKCTGCGKQYFRLPKIKKIKVMLWAVTISSVVVIGLCVCQIIQFQQQIADLNSQIYDLTEQVTTLEQLNTKNIEKIGTQAKKISELQLDIYFFNRHVVFVLNNGSNEYHKYDCIFFQNRDVGFWAFNTEAADGRGYQPCSVCH